jgi:methionyl-tRNA formyltransferase
MDVPVHHTSAINGAETVEYLRDLAPELILVNGTQLLREPILSLRPQIRHGILNLHTGLSPYSRGANCNLYMVLEGHPELVGVTVHHIDPGIDSGDIIRSAQVPMEPDDNFETIDVRSFDVGINLLLEGARDLVEGRALRVRQWEQGKLFLQRTGYHYEPWQRLQANRLLKQGMLRDYLAHKAARDAGLRLIGSAEESVGAQESRV